MKKIQATKLTHHFILHVELGQINISRSLVTAADMLMGIVRQPQQRTRSFPTSSEATKNNIIQLIKATLILL